MSFSVPTTGTFRTSLRRGVILWVVDAKIGEKTDQLVQLVPIAQANHIPALTARARRWEQLRTRTWCPASN